MAYETIIVEKDVSGIAALLLNRPEKGNALSLQMRREIAAAAIELEADRQMRVLILSGVGKLFTAGLDLTEWTSAEGPAAGAYENDVVAALQKFSGPLIGAINGPAITGGLEIALACDLLIAAEHAYFADTHVRVGLLPGWGGSVRLVQKVGLNRAKEMALTGRSLSAAEARDWGLVNRVVAANELMSEARAVAASILVGVPETVVAYKRLLDRVADVDVDRAMAIERAASIANNAGVSAEDIDMRLAKLRKR